MSTAVIALAVVVVVAVAVGLWIVVTYNALVRRRNAVNNAWSQIDVQLKRRYDLIPNLIETVRGYATHERQTFDSITAARAAAISAQGPVEQAKAENVLTGALRSVFSVAEAYPAGRAVGLREPDRVLPPVLQRRRARLQQRRPDHAGHVRRRPGGLHAARAVRGADRGARRSPGPVLTRRVP